jgi:hypothetical protein
MVRNHLPSFVVEHPSLYGLLSKGVHQLSEKECAEEMPTLRRAMEVIFRDRTTKAREVKQKAEAAKLVQQAVARHSKPA